MAIIVSDWKITFDLGGASEFQLCDWGADLDDELHLPWAQATEVSKPMGGAAEINFGRGSVGTSFTVGVYKTHATMAAARNWLLAHSAAVPAGVSKTLTVAVKDGSTFTLANTVIADGDRMIVPRTALPKTWVKYNLRGGKFVIV